MERLRGLPRRAARGGTLLCRFSSTASTASTSSSSSSSFSSHREVTSSLSRKRYAVVGSGFAGLAVCYNLLRNALSSTKACPIVVDLFDAHGKAGGGASSVAAGLLHPLNTRGNVTWKGVEAMEDALELMNQVDTLRKKSENHLSSSPSSAAATSLSKQKEQEKISFLKQTGLLKVARDEKELERFIRISNEWKGLELQIYDNKDDQVTKKKNGSLLQSLPLASQGAGLMYCPHGYAVNSPYYLSCLASACEKLAEKEASKASFNVITGVVDSIQSLEDEETYSGIILCAGAAVDTIKEVRNKFPLRLSETYTIQMDKEDKLEKADGSDGYSLLGKAYVVKPERDKAVVGAVHSDTKPTAEDALGCKHHHMSDENAASSEFRGESEGMEDMAELVLERGRSIYPRLLDDYCVNSVHAGVRGLPPKTGNSGRLPIMGRVEWAEDEIGSSLASPCWMFLGLGARGLLYHAYGAKKLTQAIASDDESLLPAELLRWKGSYLKQF